MLEALLRALGEGGLQSYQEMSRRLSVSPSLLEMMLEDLARQGYLRAVGGCEGACSGCSMGGCSIADPGHFWVLTEKGNKAAARLN